MESYVSHRDRLWLYIFVGLVIFYLVVPMLIVIPVSFSSTTAMTFLLAAGRCAGMRRSSANRSGSAPSGYRCAWPRSRWS